MSLLLASYSFGSSISLPLPQISHGISAGPCALCGARKLLSGPSLLAGYYRIYSDGARAQPLFLLLGGMGKAAVAALTISKLASGVVTTAGPSSMQVEAIPRLSDA